MNHNLTSSFNLYHGTIYENVIKVLESKQFIFKKRKDHWLGSGVYFFVDDVDKALWWSGMAIHRFRKTFKDRGILFIEGYEIKRNKLLDLDSETDRMQFAKFLKNNDKKFKMNLTSKDPEKRKIEARATLIDIMIEYYELSAVKYTFHKENVGKQKFLSQLDLDNNEIQFCISDPDTINFDNVRDITQEVI